MDKSAAEPRPLPKSVIIFRDPHDSPLTDKLHTAQTPQDVLSYCYRRTGVSAGIYELKKKIEITREIKVAEIKNGR